MWFEKCKVMSIIIYPYFKLTTFIVSSKGFKGKRCSENIDDCAAFPCKHGSCFDGINNFTCNCTGSGYAGPTCDEDINECETIKPCHPNATCANHKGTYQCICQPGFNGKNCYNNIDDCRSSPCQHGGIFSTHSPNSCIWQYIHLLELFLIFNIYVFHFFL